MRDEGAGASGLRALLERGGRDWPAPLEHHAVLDSTSDRLKERAREGAPELTVVLADEQGAGRGRQGRTWWSPPGNLYLSVLLRPAEAPPQANAGAVSLIPLAAGIAVTEALSTLGVGACLKWPNDALVGERKIGGILAEAAGTPPGVADWVVLGIGVNLVPAAALAKVEATSVQDETGMRWAPVDTAAAVLLRLRVWYGAVADRPRDVLEAWRAHAAPWWGRRVEVAAGDRRILGVATDVDDDGALLLETPDGRIERVVSGEVSRVRLG